MRGVAGVVMLVASWVAESALRFLLLFEAWADCCISAESAVVSFFEEEWDLAAWIDGSRALKRFSSS